MAKNLPQVRRDRGLEFHEEKNESSLFESGLKKIFHSKEFADCKFLVGKDKVCFDAHKLVLAMASEVFKHEVYTHATAAPILIPDIDPNIFECLLRYIYLNQSPLEGLEENKGIDKDIQVIKLWYASSKYQITNLTKKYYDMIKINVNNWFHVYVSSKMLLKYGNLQKDSDIKTLISRCQKVFSVKTPEALIDESHFTNQNIPVVYLKTIFATEHMNIENELDLFKALVKYANEYGWQPNGQFLLEEDNNGGKLLTQFQKSIREAMKQIRFLTMTLKEFDSIPAKSGFFTEFEVKTIRNRIADNSSQCVSIAGFAKHTAKKRYELLHLKLSKITKQHDEKKEKLTFDVEFPRSTLGITEPFSFGNITWRILIYVRKVSLSVTEYTLYLKCDVPDTQDWKCYAQLDVDIEFNDKKRLFENVPWYCFKCDANYSQMKPIKLENKVKICHMKLAISPHHVSYNNKRSNVSATYGRDVRDYD